MTIVIKVRATLLCVYLPLLSISLPLSYMIGGEIHSFTCTFIYVRASRKQAEVEVPGSNRIISILDLTRLRLKSSPPKSDLIQNTLDYCR